MKWEKGQRVRVRLAGREWTEGVVELSSVENQSVLIVVPDGVGFSKSPDAVLALSPQGQALMLSKQGDGSYFDHMLRVQVWVEPQ